MSSLVAVSERSPGSPTLAPRLGLSGGAASVMAWLRQMPLASVRDLSAFHDMGENPFYSWLGELSERGFAATVRLGSSRRRAGRWWLTADGLSAFDGGGLSEDVDSSLLTLLSRLPAVEWFYYVAGELTADLGRLHEFRWFYGTPWQAAVLYERGWVLLFWSGSLERESRVFSRLSSLGESLARHSVLGRSAWPSLLCFVASDYWQRELVFRAARSMGIPNLRVWCAADGSSSGPFAPAQARGWVSQPPSGKFRPAGSWSKGVLASPWSLNGINGALWRLARGAFEWPLLNFAFARKFLSLGSDQDRRAGGLFRSLVTKGVLEQAESAGNRAYYLPKPGLDLLRRQDGVSLTSLATRHFFCPGQMVSPQGPGSAHERGLMDLMSSFYGAGLPSAVGWRSWERLGGDAKGGISPDGLVRLDASPFGAGWHYVEYERSARGQARAYRKLNGYAAGNRQDSWPVLFVLWSDRAEYNFHVQGLELGAAMLTTTIGRLKQSASAFDAGWSFYGQPMSLS